VVSHAHETTAQPGDSGTEHASQSQVPAPLGAVLRAGDILALQRRIGNAATGRWLGRQVANASWTIGTHTGPLAAPWREICAPDVPASQIRSPVDPTVEGVAGPCLTHWAGGYEWFVRFHLPNGAPDDGHLIQELTMESSDGARAHFWESSWPFEKGDTEPGGRNTTSSGVNRLGRPWDDRYRTLAVPTGIHKLQGWFRHLGVVRFYAGPLPPQFKNGRADTKPTGWTGEGTRHDCYAEWDARDGKNPKLALVAFAGETKVVAGEPVTGFGYSP
jgi:hypothetical protein